MKDISYDKVLKLFDDGVDFLKNNKENKYIAILAMCWGVPKLLISELKRFRIDTGSYSNMKLLKKDGNMDLYRGNKIYVNDISSSKTESLREFLKEKYDYNSDKDIALFTVIETPYKTKEISSTFVTGLSRGFYLAIIFDSKTKNVKKSFLFPNFTKENCEVFYFNTEEEFELLLRLRNDLDMSDIRFINSSQLAKNLKKKFEDKVQILKRKLIDIDNMIDDRKRNLSWIENSIKSLEEKQEKIKEEIEALEKEKLEKGSD